MYETLSQRSHPTKDFGRSNNFRSDVIVPTIYSLENFQFIKDCKFGFQKERKVHHARKNRIQSVVENIIAKKQIQIQLSKKIDIDPPRLSRPAPQNNKKNVGHKLAKSESLTMDIDQKLNSKILHQHKQTCDKKQKMNELLAKSKNIGHFRKLDPHHEQLNFYLTSISKKKNNIYQDKSQAMFFSTTKIKRKEHKGFAQEQQEKEAKKELKSKKQLNCKKLMVVKKRPKTVAAKCYKPGFNEHQHHLTSHEILFARDSLMNTKLSRFQKEEPSQQNLKQKIDRNYHSLKQKFKNLMQTIESNCLQHNLSKSKIIKKLNRLGMTWKSEREFFKSQNVPVLLLSSHERDALNLLSVQRKKNKYI